MDFIRAAEILKPLGITLPDAVSTIKQAIELAGNLNDVLAAVQFFKAKHRTITTKLVADVVAELLALKETRGAAPRHLADLRLRLEKFADSFKCNIGSVTTHDIQTWLDGLKLSTQAYANNRRVLHLLFEFAVARGHAFPTG